MSRHINHFQTPSEGFVCVSCGRAVTPTEQGTIHRNHCPFCLASRHVDIRPGDRRASCKGTMQAVAVWTTISGEWSLIHRCTRCGVMKSNRIAGDDSEGPLLALALRPLSSLPFPIETITGGQTRSGVES